ncbi:plasmid recombination protein, partial [Shewanella chilikensis]|uniref:plasmid recombination protein n=1 Tax=Shewanella chilikensis TaxID=558541 RepID=UPI003AAB6B9B
MHRDETSPHLRAFVVPITADGRLSAKDYIGNRQKMTADQTSFAKAVQHLGLERGIERSRATHTSIKQHYAAIERGIASGVTISPETIEPKVLKKGIFTKEIESPGQVAARLTDAVKEAYQPMAANAAVSAQERRRAKELQDTAKEQRNRLERLQEPFKGLSKEQVANGLA